MVQALSTNKSYNYNSMQTLVHRDCHQLRKPHMGAPCSITCGSGYIFLHFCGLICMSLIAMTLKKIFSPFLNCWLWLVPFFTCFDFQVRWREYIPMGVFLGCKTLKNDHGHPCVCGPWGVTKWFPQSYMFPFLWTFMPWLLLRFLLFDLLTMTTCSKVLLNCLGFINWPLRCLNGGR
jgi:hypothetical protein